MNRSMPTANDPAQARDLESGTICLTSQEINAELARIRAKRCTACGTEKALSEFYKKGERWDAACKACVCNQKAMNYARSKARNARNRTLRARSRVLDVARFDFVETIELLAPEAVSKILELAVERLMCSRNEI
jgi:hypothetical protein